jgi:hypothetical protein
MFVETLFKKKKDEYEGAPCPADEEGGEVHLEVGAGADQQQHHRHERVEVEKRRLYPPRTPPSGKNKTKIRTEKSQHE